MRITLTRVLFLLCLFVLVPVASADTLFSQPGAEPPNNARAFSLANSGVYLTNTFSLGSTSDVTGATFRYWIPPSLSSSSMNWVIYSNNGGNPGTVLFSGTTSLSSTLVDGDGPYGYAIYDGAITFNSAFTLGANTYWFGLNPADTSSMYWDEAASGSGGKCWDGSSSSCNIPATTFTIQGTVPEPATLVLLGSGLIGLGVFRRRSH